MFFECEVDKLDCISQIAVHTHLRMMRLTMAQNT